MFEISWSSIQILNCPKHHRLIDDLVVRRAEIAKLVGDPTRSRADPCLLIRYTPTVFALTFASGTLTFRIVELLFVKRDGRLMVYTMWSPRVGEDLRHEVTHGYLHSVVRGLPLWLDEGFGRVL